MKILQETWTQAEVLLRDGYRAGFHRQWEAWNIYKRSVAELIMNKTILLLEVNEPRYKTTVTNRPKEKVYKHEDLVTN